MRRPIVWLFTALLVGTLGIAVYGTLRPDNPATDRNVPGATTEKGKDRLP